MKKTILTISAGVVALSALAAHAGLYIAPSSSATGPAVIKEGEKLGPAIPANSGAYSDAPYVVKESNGKMMTLGFGNNVPLSMATSQIIPKGCWKVNIDNGLESRAISWVGGKPWDEVLEDAIHQKAMAISINESECVIGISTSRELAEALAHNQTKVWRLVEGMTLKENLELWAEKAGWNLHWGLGEKHYMIEYPATLIGDFEGADGVVARVIEAYQRAGGDLPLKAVFLKGNRVLEIRAGGYSRGGN